jgi:hypothetical protein
MVVPEVKSMTLSVIFSDWERAPFLTQFAHV